MNSFRGGDQSSCQVPEALPPAKRCPREGKGQGGRPRRTPRCALAFDCSGPGPSLHLCPFNTHPQGPSTVQGKRVSKRERSCRRSPEPEGESDSQ